MEPLADASGRVDERFARRFRVRAGGDGPVSFADFMDLALFDAEVGYYTARRPRVGQARGTDFYTSSTFAGVFGPLVAAAAEKLLGGPGVAGSHHFVEVGAEPGRALLKGVPHRFGGVDALALGDAIVIPPRAVVFSNELFDAQPFHRLLWKEGGWREAGVALRGVGLVWSDLPAVSAELDAVRDFLPAEAESGYVLDVPWRAVRLLERMVASTWRGLFLAVDYGRTWGQIAEDFPQGTGRAYGGHRQTGDLLADAGRQDLTCHVCWDWLENALRRAGFDDVCRESQEAFFVKHATEAIEAVFQRDPDPLSPHRSQMKQLLHPGLMGHKFEVLRGMRA